MQTQTLTYIDNKQCKGRPKDGNLTNKIFMVTKTYTIKQMKTQDRVYDFTTLTEQNKAEHT
jgi:hypothetical protein